MCGFCIHGLNIIHQGYECMICVAFLSHMHHWKTRESCFFRYQKKNVTFFQACAKTTNNWRIIQHERSNCKTCSHSFRYHWWKSEKKNPDSIQLIRVIYLNPNLCSLRWDTLVEWMNRSNQPKYWLKADHWLKVKKKLSSAILRKLKVKIPQNKKEQVASAVSILIITSTSLLLWLFLFVQFFFLFGSSLFSSNLQLLILPFY